MRRRSWLEGSFVTITSMPSNPASATKRQVSASGRPKKAADEKSNGEVIRRALSRSLLELHLSIVGGEGPRMLGPMWVFPLLAAVVASAFAGMLVRQFLARRRPAQLAWAIALAMYGVASAAVVLGSANGWNRSEFAVFWALGAVLNVPFLAAGELMLLVRNRTVHAVLWLILVFITAYTVAVLRDASFS